MNTSLQNWKIILKVRETLCSLMIIKKLFVVVLSRRETACNLNKLSKMKICKPYQTENKYVDGKVNYVLQYHVRDDKPVSVA